MLHGACSVARPPARALAGVEFACPQVQSRESSGRAGGERCKRALREARGRADAMAALRAHGPPALLAALAGALPPLGGGADAPGAGGTLKKGAPRLVAPRAAAALLASAERAGGAEAALHLLAALLGGDAGAHVALAAADAAGLEVRRRRRSRAGPSGPVGGRASASLAFPPK